MVTQIINIKETTHPNDISLKDFKRLIGIDKIKNDLLTSLQLMLDNHKIEHWIKQNQIKSSDFVRDLIGEQRLIILSGDVGCGKTMLANSIATPLAYKIDAKVLCLESPTNVRGQGMVGELSARITSLFEQARNKVSNKKCGLLIIDEADDIATSRSQMQAHHEDRAGVNVLARQIDSLSKDNIPLAVILITNRFSVIDPAIIRRSASNFIFERPNKAIKIEIFNQICQNLNLNLSESELDKIASISNNNSIEFTYSDILKRGIKIAVMKSIESGEPLTFHTLFDTFKSLHPTPNL